MTLLTPSQGGDEAGGLGSGFAGVQGTPYWGLRPLGFEFLEFSVFLSFRVFGILDVGV